MDRNFVLFRIEQDTESGRALMRKLQIRSTPAILILGQDGKEIDWHLGYKPPPTKLFAELTNSLDGIDTARSLAEAYGRDPEDIETVSKLAEKYDGRFTDRAFELYREVVSLDPEGKRANFTENAEYRLAVDRSTRHDFEPLKRFIEKYPDSPHVADAYRIFAFLTPLYWEEYVAHAPHDSRLLLETLMKVSKDKAKLDGAIELADDMWSRNPTGLDAAAKGTMAELYMLKGEPEMAELLYGGSFIEGEIRSLTSRLWSYGDFWIKWKASPERIEAAAEAILQIMPEDPGARYQAARLYFTIGKEEKALDIFGPEFASRKWNSPSDLIRYSHFWAYRGRNLKQALAAARRAVEVDASNAENWHELAFALWKAKDLDEAIKAEEEAIKRADSSLKIIYQRQLDSIKRERAGSEQSPAEAILLCSGSYRRR